MALGAFSLSALSLHIQRSENALRVHACTRRGVPSEFATPVGKFYPRQNSTASAVNPDFSLGNEYQKRRVVSFFRMTRNKGLDPVCFRERLASENSVWNFSRKARKKATRSRLCLCFTVADVPAPVADRATRYGSVVRSLVARTTSCVGASSIAVPTGPGSRRLFSATS